jgi:glycosyltransferase involved in cell wall biosynthesis
MPKTNKPQNRPYLSVIIPSFNEQENLKRNVLKQVYRYLEQQDYNYELILSDDGSTDGTLEKLQAFAQQRASAKVLANQHRGKGPTVSSGMLAATGKWRLFTDFDQSTPLPELEKLLAYTDRYQIIIGSREIKGALRDKEPWHRHLMGRGFNWLVQTLAVPGIKDTQCGFKLFSQEAAAALFSKLQIYGQDSRQEDAFTGAFDVELLFLARKLGFAVKEVPILWRHYQTDRVNPVKDSWRMFQDIVRIRLAAIKGDYHFA